MIRSRRISVIALATVLAACSETSTTTEPVTAQHDDVCLECFYQGATLFPSSDIHLGGSPILGVLLNVNVAQLPKGTTAIVVTSDTIPAPAPPGPVQAMFARFGNAPFSAILNQMANAGLTAPSDTIPAPGPPAPGVAAPIQQLANGGSLLWLSTSYLQQKGLSVGATSLTVLLKSGRQTLYTAKLSVNVFAK